MLLVIAIFLPTQFAKILEGFNKSSTKSFNDFCSSQFALRRGSIYADIMKKSSLQSQLNILLGNIEATYLDLVGGNKWEGITASPPASSFIASPTNNDIDEHDARALAAKAHMPWDEWVRSLQNAITVARKVTFVRIAQIISRKLKVAKSRNLSTLTGTSHARTITESLPHAAHRNPTQTPR